jgi:hypothetical protein
LTRGVTALSSRAAGCGCYDVVLQGKRPMVASNG